MKEKAEEMKEETGVNKSSEIDKFLFEKILTEEQKSMFASQQQKMAERAKRFGMPAGATLTPVSFLVNLMKGFGSDTRAAPNMEFTFWRY